MKQVQEQPAISYVSYRELVADIRRMANVHDFRSRFDAICGVPRSGLLAASLMAVETCLPLYTPGQGLIGGRRVEGKLQVDKPRILLVDDSMLSGEAIKPMIELVKPAAVAAVYVAPDTPKELFNFRCRVIAKPRLFEWNLFDHAMIVNMIFDMDGVLCEDPPMRESKDPDGYKKFVGSAVPCRLPSRKVHMICTGRLKMWETATRKWLTRHNVTFDYLAMYSRHISTRTVDSIARFKAAEYGLTSATLFVESEPRQAEIIHAITRRPVLCLPGGVLYQT